MNTTQRARAAMERGDMARALMVLVRGLRRDPDDGEALDQLLTLFLYEIQTPGIESELFRGLEYCRDRAEILRYVVDELDVLGKDRLAEAVWLEAQERGVEIAPPEPEPEPVAPEPEVTPRPKGTPETEEAPKAEEVPDPKEVPESPPEPDHLGPMALELKPVKDPSEVLGDDEAGVVKPRARPAAERSGKGRLALVVGVIVMIAVTYAVVLGWDRAQEAQRIAAVDDALGRLDLYDLSEVRAQLDQLSVLSGRGDQATAERRAFLTALLQLEGFEVEDSSALGDGLGPWGLAAVALRAAADEEWEAAMAAVHQGENEHGEALAAVFARGRVCEARGDWDCALARYSRLAQHSPEFLPARQGSMRIGAARFQRDVFEEHRLAIEEISPGHVYGELSWLTPEGGEEGGQARGDDSFLRSYERIREISELLARGAIEESRETCNEELSAVAVADLVCARVAAMARDGQGALKFLTRASLAAGAGPELKEWAQTQGVRLLVGLGLAEEALELMGDRDEDEDPEVALMRARVLVELGRGEEARGVLDELSGGDEERRERIAVERVRSLIVEGDRRGAQRVTEHLPEGRAREFAEAQLAYLEGRHQDALRASWRPGEDERGLRVQVLALLADGRAREARTLLSTVPNEPEYVGLDSLRRRVQVRIGEDVFGVTFVSDDVEAISSLTMLVDWAAEAFWRREMSLCWEVIRRAQEMAPDHPELHWKLSLVRRVQGDRQGARSHLRNAWRDTQGTPELLVEIGRAHLDLGRPDHAREVFLRALLQDRRNLDAIAGLGQAYLEGDAHRGRRDLREVLGKISPTPRNTAARAELTRWLAIVHGSRDGEAEGWEYLERARALIGDRPELLLEEGRYFQALGEFEQARERYQRALQRDPTEVQAHLLLALVAVELEEAERAREHLRRLFALEPVGEVFQQATELSERLEGG